MLARTIMKSKNVPESIMILIKGNPEFISDTELNAVADRVLEEAVQKLTGGNQAGPAETVTKNVKDH